MLKLFYERTAIRLYSVFWRNPERVGGWAWITNRSLFFAWFHVLWRLCAKLARRDKRPALLASQMLHVRLPFRSGWLNLAR